MKDFFFPKSICLLTNRLITFTRHGVYIKAPSKLWSWVLRRTYEARIS